MSIKNVTKGYKTSILGMVLMGFSIYLFYLIAHGSDFDIMYAGGLHIMGVVLLFTPDTFVEILESIPSIIKKKLGGEE